MVKFCTECGVKNEDEANFCIACGNPFNETSNNELEEKQNQIKEESSSDEILKKNKNGILTKTTKCPFCGENTFEHYQKNSFLKPIYNYVCSNCGLSFVKEFNNYQLKDLNDKNNRVWVKYHKKFLKKEEWVRIFEGGLSNQDQEAINRNLKRKAEAQRKADEKAEKEKVKAEKIAEEAQKKAEQEENLRKHNAAVSKLQNLIPQHPELLSPITTNAIILKKGEQAYLEIPNVSLVEPRAVRTSTGGYGGGSVRIAKGVSIRMGGGQGRSVSHDELMNIDSGELLLTNQRLIFVGAKKSSNIVLSKIMNLTAYSDGLEVQIENRQKPQYFKGTERTVKSFKVDGTLVKLPLNASNLKSIILSQIQN